MFVAGLGPGGQAEKQSPTMDGWNRVMNNIQTQPQRNQTGFNQNQYGGGQQQQNSTRMMQPNQQQYNQANFRAQQPNSQWQQTVNMVRTNQSAPRPFYQPGYSQDFNNVPQQPMTYPSNFPNHQPNYHQQQQPMDQMQPPGPGLQQPLVIQQSLPPSQSLQYNPAAGPVGAGMAQYGAPGPPVVAGPPGPQPQPQPVVVQQQQQAPATLISHQHNPTLVPPNQIIYQPTSQHSYLQPPGTGGVAGGAPPMVISATPAPPAPSQPLVQLVAGSQPVAQPVVMYNVTANDPVIAPTPALIPAPTPAPATAPLVVGQSHAQSHAPQSSNSYNFDPSGLTPAQQLAYAQAQQQHQQQHLKKMRQRLPHVSGRELNNLHRQIKDLQHKQHQQTLQTLRLAQVQEKQAFNYLDSAFKTRQKPNTYHRVNFQLKV